MGRFNRMLAKKLISYKYGYRKLVMTRTGISPNQTA